MTTVLTAAGEVPLNPRATIGDNGAPPLETFRLHIEELMENARQWLDGEPIETQAQADEVGKLLAMIRETTKGAEEQRKVEKEPHLEAGRAVDGAWKPLTERLTLAADTAKKALAPFLQAEQTRKDEEAAKARQAAQEAMQRAQAGLEASQVGNDLAARERAEDELKAAGKLDKTAARIEKAKPMVGGGARGVSLRDRRGAVFVDPAACLKHYRERQPEALKAWLLEQAQRDVSAGAAAIPGIHINITKVAQ